MKKFLLALSILTVATLFGCKEAKNEAATPTKVTVMIYSEYIDPDMITDFEKQTGYKLQIELYEAQEEMISKALQNDSTVSTNGATSQTETKVTMPLEQTDNQTITPAVKVEEIGEQIDKIM